MPRHESCSRVPHEMWTVQSQHGLFSWGKTLLLRRRLRLVGKDAACKKEVLLSAIWYRALLFDLRVSRVFSWSISSYCFTAKTLNALPSVTFFLLSDRTPFLFEPT